MPMLDLNQIRTLLPQQYPFMLIDRILEIQKDTMAVARKNVSINEGYFEGHFPGVPVMPGALILEAAAQTAIVLFRYGHPERISEDSLIVFGGVKGKFIKPAVPGDSIRIEVRAEKFISSGGVVDCLATVDNAPIARAQLSFSVQRL